MNDGKDKLVLRGSRYGDIEHLGNKVEVTSKKKKQSLKIDVFRFSFFFGGPCSHISNAPLIIIKL